MHHVLRHVNDELGTPPRRFRREEWPELLISMPSWMPGDDMEVIFKDQRFLYEEGEVVWGTFVQANGLLYSHGALNCPATFIYSRHEDVDRQPALLRDVARLVHELRGREWDDPDEQRYGDMLENERMRAMRWKVPDSRSLGLPVYSTTVMVCRRHLPGGVLIRRTMPMLRHRDTVATIIVPHWFWPRSFRESWAEEVERDHGHSPWVTMTDAFANEIEQIARKQGYRDEWYLRPYIEVRDGGMERAIRLVFDTNYNPDRDRAFRVNGILVAISRRDADELRGLEFDITNHEKEGCYRLI